MDTEPITEGEFIRARSAIMFSDLAMRNPAKALMDMPKTEKVPKYPCCQAGINNAWYFRQYHYVSLSHISYWYGFTPARLETIKKVLQVMKTLEG